jgi:uncharacterized protein
MSGETNLAILLKNMTPVLNDGQFVFCSVCHEKVVDVNKIQLIFKEKEGITLILEKIDADILGLEYPSVYAWISLLIHSSLEAVGLTAAFSTALAKQNIPCNVVAGFYHDHIFVPFHLAEKAINVLNHFKTVSNHF